MSAAMELLPLPAPAAYTRDGVYQGHYTANQMRTYALANLAAQAGEITELRRLLLLELSRNERLDNRAERLEAALRSIAEGNLGSQPWQASYETIKATALAALTGDKP